MRFFSKKIIPGTYPALFLNNLQMEQGTTQKYLGLTNISIPCKQNNNNKKTHEMNWSFSKAAACFTSNISTDYLNFVYKPHLDYSDAAYDQSSNNAFSNNIVQYCSIYSIQCSLSN